MSLFTVSKQLPPTDTYLCLHTSRKVVPLLTYVCPDIISVAVFSILNLVI